MTAWCFPPKHPQGSPVQADGRKVKAMMHTFKSRTTSQPQRGAATLVIIMVLFFMISMVAAYTSRNLIFEQRTGANQYRSSQALEAGEAAVEWALTQLNAGRVTPSCTASTNQAAGADPSFRERYLTIDPGTGAIVSRTVSGAGSVEPRCVFDGGSANAAQWRWNCHCPLADVATATITAPLTPGPAPGFVMEMFNAVGATRPDLLPLEVASCTKLSADCVNFSANRGSTGDGVARIRTLLALRGALTRVPAGAVTLGGSLQPIPLGTALSVANSDVAANGVSLHVSGAAPLAPPPGLTLSGLPGVAGLSTAVFGDVSLAPADFLDPPLGRVEVMFSSSERKFGLFFGLRPDVYMRQPGLPVLDCSGGCDSATIRRTLILNPGRPLWLTGAGGTVTLDGSVGTVAAPALLIVEGDVALSAGAAFTGLLYGRKPNWTWTIAGGATVRGGAIGEGNLSVVGGGAAAVAYDAGVLRTLRVAQGTFVRVPGSWRDF